jgi:hypothetical protein
MRALFYIIFAPWQVHLVIALLSLGVGFYSVHTHREGEANKAEALLQGPPPLTKLADFDPKRDARYRGEVNLEVYVDPSLNTQLTLTTKRKRSSSDDVRILYFLFDPSESKATGHARAVVLVDEGLSSKFADYAVAQATGFEADKLLFNLVGSASTDPIGGFDKLIDKGLAGAGLTKAPNFMVITPWLDGRESVLAPSPNDGFLAFQFFGAIAGLFGFIALVKFLLRSKKRAPQPQAMAFDLGGARPLISPAAAQSSLSAKLSPSVDRKKAAVFAVCAFGFAWFISNGLHLLPYLFVFGILGLFYRKRIANTLVQLGFSKGSVTEPANVSSGTSDRTKDVFGQFR